MEKKIKTFLLREHGIKRIKESDWDEIYSLLKSFYSEKEILQAIEKYNFEISIFKPSMKYWKVKDRLKWYAKELIKKETFFRSEKKKEIEEKNEIFDPNEYSPDIKGIQVKKRTTFIDGIERSLDNV